MHPKTISKSESLLTKDDLYLFNEGTHFRIYEKFGAHELSADDGVYFAVWAPDADRVSVIGDFNYWNSSVDSLQPRSESGVWDGVVRNISEGALYKYHVHSRYGGYEVQKADPFSFFHEVPPRTASVVCNLRYGWKDSRWMSSRRQRNNLASPISIYEVHLGSWRRVPEDGNRPLTYRELAVQLPQYVKEMGFTHVEFLPVMEHPFYGSWGYQTTGYFAPTSRYGTPRDFMLLIDTLHQQNIGVLLDWVPSHFPTDEYGLGFFDGTHLYEHADPRKGIHPDWNTYVFNYGRNEIRSFLISSALFWLDKYHADGLRIDAVASMLYLDYSRKEGEWIPNQFGGRENLEAVSLLRRLNEEVYRNYPDVQTMAEESTAWPMVSKPTYVGGLGFGFKWDMGWMHDTLEYMAKNPIHRKFHHNNLTFRALYAFTENFILPLSHDEVVHGKGSLLGKMPGDDWQKFANLRLLFGYMFTITGKKLLFMGSELGQWSEWNHESGLDWHLLSYPPHQGVQKWVRDLNTLYTNEQGLHQLDCDPSGFEWVDCNDTESSVISYLRRDKTVSADFLIVLNFTPVPRLHYRVGVPRRGYWKEMLNSDASAYGGSDLGNLGGRQTTDIRAHGRPYSVDLTLPPLSCLILKSSHDQ